MIFSPVKVFMIEKNEEMGYQKKLVGIFESREEAEKNVNGSGQWGGYGYIHERFAIKNSDGKYFLLDADFNKSYEPNIDLIKQEKEYKVSLMNRLHDTFTDEELIFLGFKAK